jgi:hypothetical protein
MVISKSLAGVLIELRSGVEPSVPSGRVVCEDGTVRVASAIAVNASRSPEGREVHPTAAMYAGTPAVKGAHRTVDSFISRVGLGVNPRDAMSLAAHDVESGAVFGVRLPAACLEKLANMEVMAAYRLRVTTALRLQLEDDFTLKSTWSFDLKLTATFKKVALLIWKIAA